MKSIYKKLFDKDLIEQEQFKVLEAIETNKIISIFYELRLMLYVGIILLSTGIGYFAYQNMGRFGHFSCMLLLVAGIIACFLYVTKYALPYSNAEITVTHPFYDYILILASLLIIGLFSYIQVYLGLVHLLLNWSTFISAVILLFMAYRYDNRGLLSMGVTALSATFGIVISPVDWTKGEWLPALDLYNTGIILGISLVLIGQLSLMKQIKSHFRFTYQNVGLLMFFMACIAAIFDSKYPVLYAFLLLLSSGAVIYYSWKFKEFLFFLYSSISGYITLTYLFIELIDSIETDAFILLLYYFPFSCAAYIIFLVKKKNHFVNE